MKILIAYYTKTGTTAKCAGMLHDCFAHHEVTLADMAEGEIHPESFDVAIFGAPIRMGHIDKRMRTYLAGHAEALAHVDVGLFVCCGEPELAQDVMLHDIPRELYETAVAVGNFGGELLVEAQRSFFAKMFVRYVRRSIRNDQRDDDIADEDKPQYPALRPDDIERFADTIRKSR